MNEPTVDPCAVLLLVPLLLLVLFVLAAVLLGMARDAWRACQWLQDRVRAMFR